MYIKPIFGSLAWVILLQVSLLFAIQHTVANIPRKHLKFQDGDMPGHASEGRPMKRHHNSKVSKETMKDVELTGRHGDDLTDEELHILLPLLIKNTHYLSISKNRAKGSNNTARRRRLRKQLAKSHQELSQIFGEQNRLVDDHKTGKTLHLAAEKDLQLVKHFEERKSPEKKDIHTNVAHGRIGIVDEGEDILTNTAHRDSNPLPYNLSVLHRNHMTAAKANLSRPKPTTTSPHHHQSPHGNHKAPSTESSISKDDNLTGSEDKTANTSPDTSSETTQGADDSHSKNRTKQYQKTLEEWRRKTTQELINQPDVTCDCENGGSCILRIVCVCPKEYYGTRCQHKLHHHSCGDLTHGTWIRHGCTLCRCQDGNMLCMTKDIGDCDEVFDEEEVIMQPETPEEDLLDAYILPPPTPSIDDIEVEEVDLDILIFEFEKLPLPSKANSISLTALSLLLVFTAVMFVLSLL